MEVILSKHEIETPDQFHSMSEEYKKLLVRQLMIHTEGELSGADDYVEIFYKMAPNSYEKMVCCERAAEEVDHYKKGADVLKGIGIDADYMLNQSLEERNLFSTEAVKNIDSWAERGLFSFLGEGVVLDMLLEMAEGSYKPMASMFPGIIKEEKVHVAHGFRIIRDMCKDESEREKVQTALHKWWPISLDMFGHSESKRSLSYVKYGLRKFTNEEARKLYIAKTKPKLKELGLECPPDHLNRKIM